MAFCIECGQKLIDGAKFCFNCGKQVLPVQSETADAIDIVKEQTVKAKKSQSKQFSLFDNQIIFNGDLVSVIELGRIFFEFAWKKRNKFESDYEYYKFEDLFKRGLSRYSSSWQESVDLGVKTLMNYGVDYIDKDRLSNLASENFDVENVWQPIFNAANKIDEEAERIAVSRNMERASRGRWQGGGFGVKGAIKGAFQAGVMNFATDTFHGIGDSLTDSSDRAKIAKMKENVLSNSDTLSKLSNGIYEYCFSVFYSVYEILCNEGILVYVFEDMTNHNARLNNYLELHRKGEKRTSELVQFLCECIQLNPFGINYYVELYKLGLSNRKDIFPIAAFVGLKGEYQYIINSLDMLEISKIDKKMPENTIPELERKIALLEKLSSENSESPIDEYVDKYKEKIGKLEKANNEQKRKEDFLEPFRVNEIKNALQNRSLQFVWDEVNKGNVYAEYALDIYYCDLCEKDINDHNASAVKSKLLEVERFANAGNGFAIYLMNYILFMVYNRHDETHAQKSLEILINLANHRNNVSAMAIVGFWGSQEYYNAMPSKSAGVKLLMESAELYHPVAMAWLGSYYRIGDKGLPYDYKKAEYYLTKAADFGHPVARKELEKLKSGGSSCYITTAVCKSFGKPDDCYELQAFRYFRDNWLKYQDDGEKLIKKYYETAPRIVEVIDLRENSATIYQHIWENYLKECLSFIEIKEYEKCKQLYIYMVEDMEREYL